MIIQSGTVQMKSQRSYAAGSLTATSVKRRSLGVAVSRLPFANTNLGLNREGAGGKNSGSSDGNSLKGSDLQNRFLQSQSIRGLENSSQLKSLAQIQEETLSYLMRLFFGKTQNSSSAAGFTGSSAFGLTASTVETVTCNYEEEHTSFSTAGTVVTADGRKLTFQAEAYMSRSFAEYSYSKTQILSAANFCDPLVINLDTNIAQVSDQKFFFDLDGDGHKEAISSLKPGSGFLALDLNGDGKINDGNELFGAKSQNGFADLAKYDSDGNGWIDEADEIFDKLVIWTKDSQGKDVLCGLGKAGVGAIYLGNVSTEFSLNSRLDNSANARIRKTGMFLYENGTAGTIQHVDFAS